MLTLLQIAGEYWAVDLDYDSRDPNSMRRAIVDIVRNGRYRAKYSDARKGWQAINGHVQG